LFIPMLICLLETTGNEETFIIMLTNVYFHLTISIVRLDL
jgi:hypothetical protein